MVHTVLRTLHDLATLIVQVLLNQRKDLFLFLVDVLYLLRDYVVLLGLVNGQVDQLTAQVVRDLED